MLAYAFIAVLVVSVFVVDIVRRWWLENEWRRRWKNREDDDR